MMRAHRMTIDEPRRIYDALGIIKNDSPGNFESVRADKATIMRLGAEGIALCGDTTSSVMSGWLRQLTHPRDAALFQAAVGLTLLGAHTLHSAVLNQAKIKSAFENSDVVDWDDTLADLLGE